MAKVLTGSAGAAKENSVLGHVISQLLVWDVDISLRDLQEVLDTCSTEELQSYEKLRDLVQKHVNALSSRRQEAKLRARNSPEALFSKAGEFLSSLPFSVFFPACDTQDALPTLANIVSSNQVYQIGGFVVTDNLATVLSRNLKMFLEEHARALRSADRATLYYGQPEREARYDAANVNLIARMQIMLEVLTKREVRASVHPFAQRPMASAIAELYNTPTGPEHSFQNAKNVLGLHFSRLVFDGEPLPDADDLEDDKPVRGSTSLRGRHPIRCSGSNEEDDE